MHFTHVQAGIARQGISEKKPSAATTKGEPSEHANNTAHSSSADRLQQRAALKRYTSPIQFIPSKMMARYHSSNIARLVVRAWREAPI